MTRLAAHWNLAVLATAGMIVMVMLLPAEIWNHPANDEVYKGFDPNLVYASNPVAVRVSRQAVDLSGARGSNPVANLATTSWPRFNASMDLSVTQAQSALVPARLGIWSPWTGAGYFVVFGPDPVNTIALESFGSGAPGMTLVGGTLLKRTILGYYTEGARYHVTIDVDKTRGRITGRVSDATGITSEGTISAPELPALFKAAPISLTASASPGTGTSSVVLSHYILTLPHSTQWATKVNDATVKAVVVGLTIAGTLLSAMSLIAWLRREDRTPLLTRIPMSLGSLRSGLPRFRTGRLLIVGAISVYLLGNALLFPLGGHPFDMRNEELYAYVARTYGLDQLYYLPNVVSLAKIWGGVPYSENAFPYEPSMAYLFAGIGWLHSLLFASDGRFLLTDFRLEYLIKAVNVFFGLFDAALIYLILRKLRVKTSWSLLSSALFLFNPAVWFSMSVWGQTHVESLFFVLIAIFLAEYQLQSGAWLALAVACLTRPQMLVFGLLFGIVLVRTASWKQSLIAVSWTVILMFVAMVPLSLAIGPSLPVDIMLHNLRLQEGSGNGIAFTTVSEDAYSIWPLVTYAVHGASGLQRAFTPSTSLVTGDLSYQRLSQILTATAVLIVSSVLLFRRRSGSFSGAYLPLATLGVTAFLMLQTGLVATHFLLAIPLLLLCRPFVGSFAYFFLVLIWTVTTFVPMFGDMGIAVSSQQYPVLAPANNAITRFFIYLYSWDRFITAGVVANVWAVIWLAFLSLRPRAGPNRAGNGALTAVATQ